jgi:DNA-binding MarR family transcriptional regulator
LNQYLHTFVPTNFVITIMTIEQVIKSTALPLNKKVILNLLVNQQLLTAQMSELLKPYDLSSEQYNVLRILRGQHGKPANMCMIQERMIARTSNTTRLVDKLLEKALVTRDICSSNRRKMEVSITQKGIDLLAVIDPDVEAFDNTFFKHFSESEVVTLNSLLEKFRSYEK